jgi:1-acyl-sn-glycerol-3-phosphate acyltransferase
LGCSKIREFDKKEATIVTSLLVFFRKYSFDSTKAKKRRIMQNHLRCFQDRLISIFLWGAGLCAFVPLSLTAVVLSFFVDPGRFAVFTQWACRMILRCLLVRVKVEGLEHFRKDRVYLFLCNHVNILDVLVLYGYIPNYFRGVELDEHFDWFYYGLVIRRLGMIPISQTNGRSALKSLNYARQVISGGTSVLILPEGGRTLDGQFQSFKRGAFVLARKAGVDLVPSVMIGAFDIMRRGSLLIRPGRMTLKFGPPLCFKEIEGLHTDEIESRVRGRMMALFRD